MNVVGIIAEYNPFHNGHLYHLQESKKEAGADTAIAVMSGDFTQRGEPALMDKWARAKIAVQNGIDLVFELPFVYACNNAEHFAYGAVSLLDSLGVVTHLSFGSENGNIQDLMETANVLTYESKEFKEAIQFQFSKGLNYPKARYEALLQCGFRLPAKILSTPNNILAVEYLKHLTLMKSRMLPITIKRIGTGYHDLHVDGTIASATAIRAMMLDENLFHEIESCVPPVTFDALTSLDRSKIVSWESLFPLIVYRIRTMQQTGLEMILSAGEGLENKLLKAIGRAKDPGEMMDLIKSRRYTETRIKRLLTHTLIGLNRDSFFELRDRKYLYARVLAFTEKGSWLLRHIKKEKTSAIPVLTNINREIGEEDAIKKMLHYDILSSDVWNLLRYGQLYSHSDYVHGIYKETKKQLDF